MYTDFLKIGFLFLLGFNALAVDVPTFSEDVAPILYSHCVECHQPGTAAPMSLLSYHELRPWARSIRLKVAAKEMPPWFAAPGEFAFRNENRLTDSEIDTIVRWADGGSPLGDPAKAPQPPALGMDGWRIGTPDAVFEMSEPYRVEDDVADVLTEVLVETHLPEDRWIGAVEVRPGNPALVHHVVVNARGPISDEDRRPNASGMLTVYAVGTPPAVFPEGYGKLLRANGTISLAMHYHKAVGPGTAAEDRTAVGVHFIDAAETKLMTTAWLIQRELDIPPGASNYETVARMPFLDDGHLYAFLPHMHYRGKDMEFRAHYPNGATQTLLRIPRYDFNWQLWYQLEQPIAIPQGTEIEVIAHHDNSAANPANPDPTRRVKWGGASTDEMMIGYIEYTYTNKPRLQGVFPGRRGE